MQNITKRRETVDTGLRGETEHICSNVSRCRNAHAQLSRTSLGAEQEQWKHDLVAAGKAELEDDPPINLYG